MTLTELKLMVPGPTRSDLREAELTREELAIDDEGDEGDSSGEQNRFDLIHNELLERFKIQSLPGFLPGA